MTPEEKAKRYDELAKEVKDFFEGKQKMYSDITQTLEYLFPELKEDDDEKIRKALICGMYALKEQHKTCFASIPIDNVIAWLEKQGDKDGLIKELGEYKAKYTQEVLEKHLRVMNKDDERLRKTTISFLKDFADKGYENAVECIDWLEKQSEQKSQGKTALEAINEEKVDNSNRVEPKDYNSIDPHFMKPVNETSIAVNNPDAYKIGFADGEAHAKEEQWKPSDEQIKHLTYVVYDAKHKNRISTNGYEPYSYLYALLMQLKKLKG